MTDEARVAHRASRRFRIRRLTTTRIIDIFGLAFLLLVVLAAAFPGFLAPHDSESMSLSARFDGPSSPHIFGTDEFGRDIFSRVIFGARPTVVISIGSVGIAVLLGTIIGMVAGFYGRAIDSILMRLVDLMLAFPSILLALMLIAVFGPSQESLIIAMAAVFTPRFARLARGSTLAVRSEPYVEAATSLGIKDASLLMRHVFPNISGPLLVQATLTLPVAIILESSLSFLGLGIQPPTPSWGGMLSAGRGFMEIAPWITIFPGVIIALTVLAVNFIGDSLQDWANPRSRGMT